MPLRESHSRRPLVGLLAGVLALFGWTRLGAIEVRSFSVGNLNVVAEDISAEVLPLFQFLRFNEATEQWNFELVLTNRGERVFLPNLFLTVEGFANTTGPIAVDGVSGTPPKSFLRLNNLLALAPGGTSRARSVALGFVEGAGAPRLQLRVFGVPSGPAYALGLTRSLDEAGLPLADVTVSEDGPSGARQLVTDPAYGVVTLGQSTGDYVWKFERAGHLPTWRKETLLASLVRLIPNPRLARRNPDAVAVSAGTTQVQDLSGAVRLVIQSPHAATVTLTVVDGQTLPGRLPPGWSPLSAFWVEGIDPAMTVTASVQPAGPVTPTDMTAFIRWNPDSARWDVLDRVTGDGVQRIESPLSGAGAHALVVADAGILAPPAPVAGAPLEGSSPPPQPAPAYRSGGTVSPSSSPASLVATEVTATASVWITNTTGVLPSGLTLRSELSETYRLQDASTRHVANYETFITAYRRPVGTTSNSLLAMFPLRPRLLFAGDELAEATVRVDVPEPDRFRGGVFEEVGGSLKVGRVEVIAAADDYPTPQAATLRVLDTAEFSSLVGPGQSIAAAFDLTVASVAPGRHLGLQVSNLPPNRNFVLSRVLSGISFDGLEPVERLASDAGGALNTLEPAGGERLPGLRGAGQYLLVQVEGAQGLLSGVTRNSLGQTIAGMPVRVTGQPWLTFSDGDGVYRLVAPAGAVQVSALDLANGDAGYVDATIIDPATPLVLDLGTSTRGPRVATVAPPPDARRVSRVTPIVVTFTKPVNPATLLNDGVGLLGTNGVPVPASLSLNLRNTVATLLPVDPLAADTVHTIRLSTAIKDGGGLGLEGPVEFAFTTAPEAARGELAKLTVFQPGATNLNIGILDVRSLLPGFDEIADRANTVVAYGSPGTAEGEVPVILVNESTGETATVLSKVDGSFAGFIHAGEEDFISAVFVNLNGTRNGIGASEQRFDDGSTGLYRQGGRLSEEGEFGSIELDVQAGSIPQRTRFRVDSFPLAELTSLIAAAPPTDAQALGSFRLGVRGDLPKETIELSFPIDVAGLQLPEEVTPETAGYVLTAVTEVDGELAYHVIDDMRFENGRLVTKSPPLMTLAMGLVFLAHDAAAARGVVPSTLVTPGQAFTDLLLAPMLIKNRTMFRIHGRVTEGQPVSDFNGAQESLLENILTPQDDDFEPLFGRILPGAIVTAVGLNRDGVDPQQEQLREGRRVIPGGLYAIADGEGNYGIHVGIDLDSTGYVVTASHPYFPGRRVARRGPPFTGPVLARVNLVFTDDPGSTNNSPPVVRTIVSPARPPVGGTATVVVSASDQDSRPTISLDAVSVDHVTTATNGALVYLPLPLSTLSISNLSKVEVGSRGQRDTFLAVALTNLEMKVEFAATAADASGLRGTNLFTVFYGGFDDTGTNALPQPDQTDTVGPSVVATIPAVGTAAWAPGQPLTLQFSEAVKLGPQPVSIVPAAGTPALALSANQSRLAIAFPEIKPGVEYLVTVELSVTDLSGNALDQDPGTPGPEPYVFRISTPPQTQFSLGSVGSGGGALSHGGFAFVLDRAGETDGALLIYRHNSPAQPARFNLPPFPRDFALIPNYSFRRTQTGPVETRTLLAITGGTVGGVPGLESRGIGAATDGGQIAGGPWFWLVDIGTPETPTVIGTALLSLNTLAVVPKVSWRPPFLGYLESSADLATVNLVNLQAFILDEYLTQAERNALPLDGRNGVDDDRNGDFVGPNDVLPLPNRFGDTFGGRVAGFSLGDTRQFINDFDFASAGSGLTVAIVAREGVRLDANGLPLTNSPVPAVYRTLFAGGSLQRLPASVVFSNANPVRVTLLPYQELIVSNRTELRDLALVSVKRNEGTTNGLVVIDISDPLTPSVLNELPTSPPEAAPFGVQIREDGLLAWADGSDLLLIDPRHLALRGIDGSQPAVVGRVPGAGTGGRTFDSGIAGLHVVSLGGQNTLVATAPRLRFVSATNLITRQTIESTPDLRPLVAMLREETSLFSGRLSASGGAVSTLSPPNPAFHYYVAVDASGWAADANREIEIGLESLNRSGYPLQNKGSGFPPVRSLSPAGLLAIGQSPRLDCDLTITPLKARRLSDDPTNPFFNLYLSRPIALTYENLDQARLDALRSELDRAVLWSGHSLRAFIDPTMINQPLLGAFAARLDAGPKVLIPRAAAVAETLPGTYIMGPNPPGLAGHDEVPGTFGTVSAHNGEFRHDTVDMVLPGRRMPIEFHRHMGGQDVFGGPFGRAWDHFHNQQLTEYRASVFASSSRKPLIIRATAGASVIGEQGDVEFHTGEARTILFRHRGKTPVPAEVASDPLVQELGWKGMDPTYYLPEPGVFDLLFRFPDGRFVRLTPDGTQFWYSERGRLEKIYDRYPANQQVLTYNDRGELAKITDRSIGDGSRFLEIGYWRLSADALFTDGLDRRTDNVFIAGNIARLRDYSMRDVLFDYNAEGLLQHRDGVEVGGANGLPVRQRTIYLVPDGCGAPAQGVIAGNGAPETGTPLFTIQSTNSAGSFAGGAGAAGPVVYQGLNMNSAATVDGSTATATGPDGTRTKFTFNAEGYARELILQPPAAGPGAGQPEARYVKDFSTNGLLTRIVYPEGNEVQYFYNINSPNLRARANLLREVHVPGPRGGQTLEATYSYDERYMVPAGTIKDFNGNFILYTPRTDGKDVDRILYPAGAGTHQFTHDENGQLDFEITPEGVRIDYDFSVTTGFLLSKRLGDAPPTTFNYFGAERANALGMPNLISLPSGASLNVKYDDRLQVTELNRGQYQEQRTYDANGNVVRLRRKVDTADFYEELRGYNQFDFLTNVVVKGIEVDGSPQDLTFTYAPDAAWRVQSITYPGGERRTFSYDHLGYVSRMELGESGAGLYVEDYARDRHGNLLALKQGGRITRTLGYDGHDRLLTITNKAGTSDQVATFTYHGNGNRKRALVTDSLYGILVDVDVDVDALGRPTMETRSGNQATAILNYSYPADAAGGVTRTDGPRQGNFASLLHDSAGRPDAFQNPLVTVNYLPDGAGKILNAASAEFGVTYNSHLHYNDLDDLELESDDLGQLVRIEPRVDGSPAAVYDGLDQRTEQEFTRLGEPVESRRPNGVEFQYQYSSQRLPRKVADKTDQGHSYAYDQSLRLTSTTLRNGQEIHFESPNALNLPETIQLPGGGQIHNTYDEQGRILSQDTVFTGRAYQINLASFDALGRLRQISYGTNAGHSAVFTYDKLGPLTGVIYNEQFGSFSVGYDIYEDASVKRVIYPSPGTDSITVGEDREASGRLQGITSEADSIYHNDTHVGAELPGDVSLGGGIIKERNTYDLRKRLVARRYEDTNGVMLADVRYQYDGANNRAIRQLVHRHGRTDFFGYDAGNRLKHADIGARPAVEDEPPRTLAGFLGDASGLRPGFYGRDYLYDDDGGPGAGGLDKLLGATNTIPDANLLAPRPPFAESIGGHDDFLFPTQVDGVARAPDPLGNTAIARLYVRATGPDPFPVMAALGYNAFSQLVEVSRADGITIAYQHQPGGLMNQRTVRQGGSVLEDTAFVYDRGRLISEIIQVGSSNVVRARYYYADTDSPVAADLRDGNGNLRRYYYLKDEQNSVIALANDQGIVVERIQYDPFGQPLIEGHDTQPPRVAVVALGVNDELLVQFTERVLPPLASTGPGTNFISATQSLAGRITLGTTGGVLSGDVIYDEANTAGTEFGALIRFRRGATLPASFTLQIDAGAVTDEWGNSNLAQFINLVVGGPPGTVLYQDPAGPGATAAPRLARSAVGNPFLFHGQYFDYDAGLVYLRARHYDPYTGHFLQRDPLEYEDSVNPYAGMGFNPVSFRDPTGRRMVGSGGGLRLATPNLRPSRVVRTSNGRVGANYQKLASYTMAGRRADSTPVRPSRANSTPDAVTSFDRRAAGDRARASAEAEIRSSLGEKGVNTYFIKRQLKEYVGEREAYRRRIQEELGGVHEDFTALVMQDGYGTARLSEHIWNYKGAVVAAAPHRISDARGQAVRYEGYPELSAIYVADNLDSVAQIVKTAGHEFFHDFAFASGKNTPWGKLDYRGTKVGLEEVLAELNGIRMEVNLTGLSGAFGKSNARVILEQKGVKGIIEDVTVRYGAKHGFTQDELMKAFFPGIK